MTREEIIRMARQIADTLGSRMCDEDGETHGEELYAMSLADIEDAVELVAEAKNVEHKEAMRLDIHSCGPTCKRYACVATREAVAAEREACAKVCEEDAFVEQWKGLSEAVKRIRARSNAE